MSYFFKHILPWQVMITIIYLIYMFVYMFVYKDWYKFLISVIPAVFLIFKIYYDKSKYVFTYFRKKYAWFKNPGVHWFCSYVYKLDNDISFLDLSKKYIEELRKESYDIKDIYNADYKLLFSIDNRRLSIYYDDAEQEIKIEYGSNVSYKESIKLFEDDFLLYKRIFENLTANTNEYSYTINLKFTEYNPFYSLYIKNYADIKVENFNLNYSVDKLRIEISDKVMFIHSDDEKSIIKAMKNYLIVSE